MKQNTFALKIFLVLTLLGGGLHLLSLRWSIFQYSPDEPSTSAVNNMFVVSTYVVLGGILYGLLLRLPVSEAIRQRRISLRMLFQGGFLAMFGTVVALQVRCLAICSVLTYQARIAFPSVREGSLKYAFLACMVPIEAYGLIEIIYFAALAFVCGVLIAALAGTGSRVVHSRSSS